MFLKAWQFITLVLTALVVGMSFSHVLEMPGKFRVAGSLWLTFQHTLYRAFATVGGPIEIGAIVSMGVLAYAVRAHRGSLLFTSVAGFFTASAFVIWVVFVDPVNNQTGVWTPETMPADWSRWRTQWEYSHAARFALHLLALCALLISIMSSSNGRPPAIRRPGPPNRY
jgi:hypothetical protein